MSPLVNITIVKKHIAVISLNRPDAANALSKELIQALSDYLTNIDKDDTIHCTVITGSGNRSFCAGADLKERIKMTDKQTIFTVRSIGKLAEQIEQMKMPTIASLNGVAFGGGLELALACDLRVAVDHSVIGLTETALGIIPGAGGTQRLSRLIGLAQAKRLIYTASRIDSKEALKIGILQYVFNSDTYIESTIELAESIIKNSPSAIKLAKKAIDEGFQSNLPTGLEIEHFNYLKTISSDDRKEGLKAFAEKRKPRFKGK